MKNNNHIVYTTILICFMGILFTAAIIVLDNYSYIKKEDSKKEDIEIQIETQTETLIEAETEEDIDSGIIYISDTIDLTIDDTPTHNVATENNYVDTMELPPGMFHTRKQVKKKDISADQFLTSYAGIETASIIFGGETKVSVPTEIILYNAEHEASNSYLIRVDVTDEASYIKSFGWSTMDSSKVALSKTSGRETVVSAVGGFTGETTIQLIITYDAGNGLTATESNDIHIKVQDMVGDEIPLCDRDGNPLYLDSKGALLASLSDYAKQDVFYSSVETTICQGIDVSLYQKEVDWKLVAESGIDFAIIRCGFRGAATAKLVEDAYFRRNIEGAIDAGLQVGVYFFTQAISVAEAREEAEMVLSLCKEYPLDLPIFIDTEGFQNARANSLDKDTRTKVIKAFCERISAAGMDAGVYASKDWFYGKLHAEELEQYCIWVAQYSTECDYKGKADYWQYTSTGKVNGIEGKVDLNVILP